jgi:hypothetical protein
VTPWTFPGQDSASSPAKEAADSRAEELFLQILVRLTLAGVDVTHTTSRTGAAEVLARQPEAVDAKIGKSALLAAQDRLMKSGRIYVATVKRRNGREAPCLRVRKGAHEG